MVKQKTNTCACYFDKSLGLLGLERFYLDVKFWIIEG